MRQFKFKNTEKTADQVISAIEARAKRQSAIYRLGFIIVAFLLIGYVLNTMSVMVYDGYIYHKEIQMRAISNMSIVKYYVKPGDIVNEGDTLYSYLMVDWLENQANPYYTHSANEKKTDSDLRIAKYRSEIIETNNTIDSLKIAINNITNVILSGVKTEDELVRLNLELAERTERSKHLRRAISAEYYMQSKYKNTIVNNSSLTMQGAAERIENLKNYGSALRYRLAFVDLKIIDIQATKGMMTFEREDVLTFQPIGHPEMTNSHIAMIVDADRYDNVDEGMEVDVYAGGKFLCEANVSFLGVRMAEAFSNMESLLDRSTEIFSSVIVTANFKEGYELPERYIIHNYPVEIRHRVWGDLSRWLNFKEWFNKEEYNNEQDKE